MRFLFCVIPEKGHLHPMIGPALYLQEQGHEVVFFADEQTALSLRKAGLIHSVFYPTPSGSADTFRGQVFAEQVRDAAWLRQWIKRLLVEQAEAYIPAFRDAIQATGPDMVVADPMLYAAIIAAHCEDVRWVVLSNSLNPVLSEGIDSELLSTVQELSTERASLFVRHGMVVQFRGCDVISPRLTVVFTTEEFVGQDMPGVVMVGPSLPPRSRGDEPDFPWGEIDPSLPLVYMSLGSQIYYQPRMYETLIAAAADKPLQVVMSVGDLDVLLRVGKLPPNVLAVRYAPQLALLARASVMITHGGANSVMEALSFGVPLLCTPICNDQFHQAFFIRQSGTGIELDLNTANVDQVEAALQNLIETSRYREQAQRIARSYARNGAKTAALQVEQAC